MIAPRVSELEHICGLDFETGGLNEQGDQILEVAAVFGRIRGGRFEERARYQRVIPLLSDVTRWHPVVLDMHAKNGLLVEASAELNRLREIRNARSVVVDPSPVEAYHLIDSDLYDYAPSLASGCKWTLLGNSVHFDLRFLWRCLPEFSKNVSHRVFDISTVRLFCETLGHPYEPSEKAHRAMADVEQSLALFAKYHDFACTLGAGP